MKKFTSILCALVIALGVNAAPQFKKAFNGLETGKQAIVQMDVQTSHKAPKALKEEHTPVIGKYVETPYPSDGDIYVYMRDETEPYAFTFDIRLADVTAGLESGKTYTLADMDGTYTGVIDYTQGTQGERILATEASFTKTVNEDGSFDVVASIVDVNGDTWKISYSQAAAVITPIELKLNGILDKLYGAYFYIEAANEDSTQYIVLLFDGVKNIVGEFSFEDFISNINYTRVQFVDGENVSYYQLKDAAVTGVWDAEASVYYVTGQLLMANYSDATDQLLVTLDLTITGEAPSDKEAYDASEDYIHDFAFPVEKYYPADEEEGTDPEIVISAEEVDEETQDLLYISLHFPFGDVEAELPDGVYEINASGAIGTALSCSVDDYILGSFAGTKDDEGYINVPFWYMMEGSITVGHTGEGEERAVWAIVNATNSDHRAIKCVLGEPEEQAIDNVENATVVTKKLENGRLVIEKNGVRYNALGTVVK